MSLILLLVQLLSLYSWVIIARALISWVSPDPRNPIVLLLGRMTEPILAPMRKLVPPSALGGVDISPILALVAIHLVRTMLLSSITY